MGKRMVTELRSSSERVGQLYPILLDYHGNIIDGEHRYGADEGWRTIRLNHIRTEKDRLIARIISNTVRRSVPRKEKTELLNRLGEIYLNEGVEPGRVANKMADETGMSYRWVMKYLAAEYKQPYVRKETQSARRAESVKLVEPPEGTLVIRVYGNTDFVNVLVKKPLYERLEEKAKRLETTPDKLIYSAILLILKT